MGPTSFSHQGKRVSSNYGFLGLFRLRIPTVAYYLSLVPRSVLPLSSQLPLWSSARQLLSSRRPQSQLRPPMPWFHQEGPLE